MFRIIINIIHSIMVSVYEQYVYMYCRRIEYTITKDDLQFICLVLITSSHNDILISHISMGFITGIQANAGIN